MSDNDGWIEWRGVGNVPDIKTLAAIRFCDDDTLESGFEGLRWVHVGFDGDIVAYKLREPVSENTPQKPNPEVFHATVDLTQPIVPPLRTKEEHTGLSVSDPLAVQIGGNHYKDKPIQPVQYAMANKLGPCEFSVVKYVTRHKEKNGRQDIEKAIHFLQILLAAEYPESK